MHIKEFLEPGKTSHTPIIRDTPHLPPHNKPQKTQESAILPLQLTCLASFQQQLFLHSVQAGRGEQPAVWQL